MVKKTNSLFQCKECGLKYKEQKIAQKCEKWCQEHHTCHIEIIKHSVNE